MSAHDLTSFGVYMKKLLNVDYSKLPPRPANEYVNADGMLTVLGRETVRDVALAEGNALALKPHDCEEPDRCWIAAGHASCPSCEARADILRAHGMLPDWTAYDAALAKAIAEAPISPPARGLGDMSKHPLLAMIKRKASHE